MRELHHRRGDVSSTVSGRERSGLTRPSAPAALKQIDASEKQVFTSVPQDVDPASEPKVTRPSVAELRSPDKAAREKAWEDWYKADWDKSVRFANRFGGHSNGEDLAQRAWMKVMERFADDKAIIRDENPSGYLWRVINNQAIDDARKVERRGGYDIEFEDEIDHEESDFATPSTHNVEAAVVNRLAAEQALDEIALLLGPEFHDVLRGKAADNTNKEISEDTGIKQATVNTQVFRIRKNLDPDRVADIVGRGAVDYHRSHLRKDAVKEA